MQVAETEHHRLCRHHQAYRYRLAASTEREPAAHVFRSSANLLEISCQQFIGKRWGIGHCGSLPRFALTATTNLMHLLVGQCSHPCVNFVYVWELVLRSIFHPTRIIDC